MAKETPWQAVRREADSSRHNQDTNELSASLQTIFRIAEMMANEPKPQEDEDGND